MSAIDDIINANLECNSKCGPCPANKSGSVCGFTAEHIRLMEDERKAAEAFLADACIVNNVCHECDGADGCTIRLWRVSLDALDAYRKERGMA